jgi:hypothetical protein
MQLANAALGVLTIITAQEHLDRINKQLTKIDGKIDMLLRQYNNDKIGKIQGSIHYLKSILSDLGNMSNNKIYLTKIEDIAHQCYQEIQSTLQEFPRSINGIAASKEKAWFNIDDFIKKSTNQVSLFEQNMLLCLGNLEVLSICLKMRTDILGCSSVNEIRLSDIENWAFWLFWVKRIK